MTPGTDIQTRPTEREQKEADAITKVTDWVIKSNEDAVALDQFLVGLNELKKEIIADFKDSKAAAKAAHQAICDQESSHLDIIEKARSIGKPKIKAWQDEQKRLEEEEAKRLSAEAKKKADEEALAQAQAAEKAGDKAAAEAIIEQAAAKPAPIVKFESTAPKFQTRTSSGRWGATVTAPKAPQDAVAKVLEMMKKSKTAAGIQAAQLLAEVHFALNYMEFSSTKLQKQADSTKDNLKVLGVTFAPKQ